MVVVTTICIVGFPTDVLQRELRNLCRFIAGFEDANIVGKSGTLFVKFATVSHARAAINSLDGKAFDLDTPHTYMLKADFAKREMEVRHGNNLPLSVNPNSGALSTITVLGVHSKGRTHDELHRWFQKFPGFSALQVNERIDAVFVKFNSQADAERALHEANAQFLGAEWARRNMDDDVEGSEGGFKDWRRPKMEDERPAKRHKSGGRDDIDTLAVMNAKAKGLGQQEALNFFSELPGFITMQVSERIDGIFVKFENPALAEQAMNEANELNVGAEWARRNLEADDEAPAREPKAPWQRNPEISTITILGLGVKGLDREEVGRWAQRQPNFQKIQVNEKIDAMFVKFTDRKAAEKAIRDAGDRGYGAELSRRNMDEDMPSDRDRDRDRRRADDLDTIAILGVKGKGHSVESIAKWLAKQRGFIKYQANDRIDGLFAKFMTSDHAERAMEDANSKMQFGAEWARRNLET